MLVEGIISFFLANYLYIYSLYAWFGSYSPFELCPATSNAKVGAYSANYHFTGRQLVGADEMRHGHHLIGVEHLNG